MKYGISRGLSLPEIIIVNQGLILYEVLFSKILLDPEVFEYLEVVLPSFLLLSKISIGQFSNLGMTANDLLTTTKTIEFEILALVTSVVKTSISSMDSFCFEVASL